MMMIDHKTVGGFAASVPDALPVFHKLGIDFCCGGKRPLREALAEKGLDEDRFTEMVEAEQQSRKRREEQAEQADYTKMSPAVLTAYIEDTHHDYLRQTLPQIGELLLAVLRAHGQNHRELFEVYRLFGSLKADLEQHLVKEEALLFPGLAASGATGEAAALAAEIVAEHEAAGELLEKLRSVTHDYAAPADACRSFRRLYALLPELEEDLHLHIHLENNILLKDFD